MLPGLAFSVTHTVKLDGSGDFTAIQAALDASAQGDTVLAYPGRYYENLTIPTDHISLISLEAITNEEAYIDSTIIDGNRISSVIIVGFNRQNISIRGLSLVNSKGNGLGIAQSSVTVTNCRITDCLASNGAGIYIGGSTVTLSGVEIFGNYAVNFGGGYTLPRLQDMSIISHSIQ
jgi:pectin methylesterase-like acyl-CoA thioesterase